MQGWLKMWKIINVKHYIDRIKDKNHIIISTENTKFLKENTGISLCDLGLYDFLDITWKAHTTTVKADTLDIIKTLKKCASMDTIMKVRRNL